ncbi:hypothetical protein ACFL34_01380 [Candidatus Sumerlaeota bacterium]
MAQANTRWALLAGLVSLVSFLSLATPTGLRAQAEAAESEVEPLAAVEILPPVVVETAPTTGAKQLAPKAKQLAPKAKQLAPKAKQLAPKAKQTTKTETVPPPPPRPSRMTEAQAEARIKQIRLERAALQEKIDTITTDYQEGAEKEISEMEQGESKEELKVLKHQQTELLREYGQLLALRKTSPQPDADGGEKTAASAGDSPSTASVEQIAAQKKADEAERVAAAKKIVAARKLAEEKRLAEEKKLAEEKRLAEEEQIAAEFPAAVKELRELQKSDKAEARAKADKMREELLGHAELLQALKKSDPEAYKQAKQVQKLDSDCEQLGREFGKITDEKERAEVRKQLRKLLEQAFDARMAMRGRKALELEAELIKACALLKKRLENREYAVERRLNELLDEEDATAW